MENITIEQIERAIQEVEDMAYHSNLKKDITAESMCVIIRELQENIIKKKGCEYCQNHTPIVNQYSDYGVQIDEDDLTIWDGLRCLEIFEIDYCPFCGRKFEDKDKDGVEK